MAPLLEYASHFNILFGKLYEKFYNVSIDRHNRLTPQLQVDTLLKEGLRDAR